ncbi:MAG: hypothetical protein J6K82_01045 [Alphaproteobacteria bacterium]|nr:hypothetical protein [Alphaproteobacteria bacterium]
MKKLLISCFILPALVACHGNKQPLTKYFKPYKHCLYDEHNGITTCESLEISHGLVFECKHTQPDNNLTCTSTTLFDFNDLNKLPIYYNEFEFKIDSKPKSKSQNITLIVNIHTDLETPLTANKVNDKNQRSFKFNIVSDNCYDTYCDEKINIFLDREYISKNIENGISLKIYGKNNQSSILHVEPQHIADFDKFLTSKGL